MILNPNHVDEIKYYLTHEEESLCLITFDDGYSDQYDCAQYLASKGLSAYFFPPPINVIDGSLLDVNAIHMIIGNRLTPIRQIEATNSTALRQPLEDPVTQ